MPRCAGSKPNGTPCERIVGASQSYCYSHDPGRSEERRQAASRAGKSKPNKEIRHIKRRLSDLADAVLLGTTERGDAAVVGQVLNVYLRAVSIEMKVKEVEELEARLEELESLLEQGRERRWG